VLFDGNGIGWRYFACHVIGIVAGVLLGDATEYYTAAARSVRPGQVLGLGMLSGFPPAVIISVVVLACHGAGGAYGIAVSAVGMLSTLGVVLGAHAFAPIADNAAGIAEMTPRCTEEVRRCTDTLDTAGNAGAAAGEGLGLGAAVLTAISLLNAFAADVPVACTVSAIVIPRCLADSMHLTDSTVIAGLIIGAILPFVFAALSTLSVRKVAGAAGVEVERQLRAIPGLLEGRDEAACDSTACVTACTKSSLNQMVLPGLIAVLTPISVGLLVGARCLGGLLAGTVASGLVLAASMRTSHARDVSPPAINVLMKLAAAVSLVLARVFRDDWVDWWRGGLVLALEIALCGATWYYVWVLAEDLESPEEDTETPAANRRLAQGKRTMRGGIPNPDAGIPDEGLRDGSLVKRSTRV
jgi:Na+/H+-translocating membrane pyrophosphatase